MLHHRNREITLIKFSTRYTINTNNSNTNKKLIQSDSISKLGLIWTTKKIFVLISYKNKKNNWNLFLF